LCSSAIGLLREVNQMSDVKYEMHVVEIGPLVSEFIAAKILVFFETGAPPELAEFSILHEPSDFFIDVEPGDSIVFDEQGYRVTAVGTVANQNIRALGHLIMKANGRTEPELPGDVCVEDKELPPIKVGTTIRIIAGESGD
jgi:PTS system glucitol/sorbitol-specific IIA component